MEAEEGPPLPLDGDALLCGEIGEHKGKKKQKYWNQLTKKILSNGMGSCSMIIPSGWVEAAVLLQAWSGHTTWGPARNQTLGLPPRLTESESVALQGPRWFPGRAE